LAIAVLFVELAYGSAMETDAPATHNGASRFFSTTFAFILLLLVLFPIVFVVLFCYWKKRTKKRLAKIGTEMHEELDLSTGPRGEEDVEARRVERPNPFDAPPPYAYPPPR